MGGSSPKAPDNSAQIEAQRKEQERLAKKESELQAKREATATEATESFNRRRRGKVGRKSLIATSELGTTDNLGS